MSHPLLLPLPGTQRASQERGVGRITPHSPAASPRIASSPFLSYGTNRDHGCLSQDTGIKAIVSGLVMAQAKVLLASSLNEPASKMYPEAGVCAKPHSGYIQLIADWRTELFRKEPETLWRLFPFGNATVSAPATSTDSNRFLELDVGGEGRGMKNDVSRNREKAAEGPKKRIEGVGELNRARRAAVPAEPAGPAATAATAIGSNNKER